MGSKENIAIIGQGEGWNSDYENSLAACLKVKDHSIVGRFCLDDDTFKKIANGEVTPFSVAIFNHVLGKLALTEETEKLIKERYPDVLTITLGDWEPMEFGDIRLVLLGNPPSQILDAIFAKA